MDPIGDRALSAEASMKLLLTVARRPEVDTALEAGADLVDVKDPSAGSLGRPAGDLLEAVARRCEGRCPVSVPLGDGPHRSDELRRMMEGVLAARPAYVKVGLAGAVRTPAVAPGADRRSAGAADDPDPRPGRWLEAAASAIAAAEAGTRLVAVTFADARDRAPSPENLVSLARRHGADGVMLDTLSKDAGTAVDALGRRRLQRWADAARRRGLTTGVAGGLDATSIPRLHGLEIDVVGVRGGACRGGRRGRLDPERCRDVRRAVDATGRAAPAAG